MESSPKVHMSRLDAGRLGACILSEYVHHQDSSPLMGMKGLSSRTPAHDHLDLDQGALQNKKKCVRLWLSHRVIKANISHFLPPSSFEMTRG